MLDCNDLKSDCYNNLNQFISSVCLMVIESER